MIDDLGNVVADVPGGDGPRVLLAAHLDSVFPEGTDVRMGEDFVEWEVVPGCWLQLQEGLEAGQAGPLRFAVDDIEVARAFLDEAFGIEAGPAVRVDVTLSTCDFFDPFGNPLGFLQVHAA